MKGIGGDGGLVGSSEEVGADKGDEVLGGGETGVSSRLDLEICLWAARVSSFLRKLCCCSLSRTPLGVRVRGVWSLFEGPGVEEIEGRKREGGKKVGGVGTVDSCWERCRCFPVTPGVA